MSTRPSIASLLDQLQGIGQTPTVNPTKTPWTVSGDEDTGSRAMAWFGYGLAILLLLVAWYIAAPVGPPGFIYEQF